MNDAEDKKAALNKLMRLCEINSTPKLTVDELEEILESNQIVRTWQADTVFEYGQGVRPTIGVGYWFKVIKPGRTGMTEPSWRSSFSVEMAVGTKITDNEVVYQEMGVDLGNAYNVRAAAYEGWQTKCSRSARFTSGGPQMASIHQHCIEMRDSFREVLVA